MRPSAAWNRTRASGLLDDLVEKAFLPVQRLGARRDVASSRFDPGEPLLGLFDPSGAADDRARGGVMRVATSSSTFSSIARVSVTAPLRRRFERTWSTVRSATSNRRYQVAPGARRRRLPLRRFAPAPA